MALDIWTESSEYNLGWIINPVTGIIEEGTPVNIPLPARPTVPATFSLISGNLPQGLLVSGSAITGTAAEVSGVTEYRFVIRATDGQSVSDRTFKLVVSGEDLPTWVTPAGVLPVGPNQLKFTLDNRPVNFQLTATDTDPLAELTYYIPANGGDLPSGLQLTASGLITGIVDPLYQSPQVPLLGNYDSAAYDTDGFSFEGDSSEPGISLTPVALGKLSTFNVACTDGRNTVTRIFQIYVFSADLLSADSVALRAGNNTLTADSTDLRSPAFSTSSDLGEYRASNYQIMKISSYNGITGTDAVFFDLLPNNPDCVGWTLQVMTPTNQQGSGYLRMINVSGIPQVGHRFTMVRDFYGATSEMYTVTQVTEESPGRYLLGISPELSTDVPDLTTIYLGAPGQLPPGMTFDPENSVIHGEIPYQPAVSITYTFTIKATRVNDKQQVSSALATFNIKVIGEIDTSIKWESPTTVGSLIMGAPSMLRLAATTPYEQSRIVYSLKSGQLPPGITLTSDGSLVGRAQYPDIINVQFVQRTQSKAVVVTATDHQLTAQDTVNIGVTADGFSSTAEISLTQATVDELVETDSYNGLFLNTYRIQPIGDQPLLCPEYTDISGLAAATTEALSVVVSAKHTSGRGTDAVFLIRRPASDSIDYAELAQDSADAAFITLLHAGAGYQPGDSITVSGSDLGGQTPDNDLTFTVPSGMEFWYNITKGQVDDRVLMSGVRTQNNTTYINVVSESAISSDIQGAVMTSANHLFYNNAGVDVPMQATTGAIDAVMTQPQYPTQYQFTASALDKVRYSEVVSDFVIEVEPFTGTRFSNINMVPMLSPSDRDRWSEFVNDSTVFPPELLYRINDPEFGVQRIMSSIIYGGIETKLADQYMPAILSNTRSKRFNFGLVKKASAIDLKTSQTIYEVVYVELIDPLELDGRYLPKTIQFGPDDHTQKNPVSISIWRDQINAIPGIKKERRFLPQWMRSTQPGDASELGFVLAVPICYCQPGTADTVVDNINNGGFDFSSINYTVDRFVIDHTLDANHPAYLPFSTSESNIR